MTSQRGLPASARMRDVLYWAALGKTNAEIGEILGISEHTVRNHFRDLAARYSAHGTNSRTMIVAFAIARGDLPPEKLKELQRIARREMREPYKTLAHRIS